MFGSTRRCWDFLFITPCLEHHAHGRRVGRRRWHVFENGTYTRHGEAIVVARFRIEHREILVHPLPEVLTSQRQTRTARARYKTLRNREAERNFPHLEIVRRVNEVIGLGFRWPFATRSIERRGFVDSVLLL